MGKKKKKEAPESSPEINEKQQVKGKVDPVKLFTYVILGLCLVIFVWHVWSDRKTPYTDQAKVKGLAIQIAPRVSGYITDIKVQLHSMVKQGDTIFQIDKRPFVMAVKISGSKIRQYSSAGGCTYCNCKIISRKTGNGQGTAGQGTKKL